MRILYTALLVLNLLLLLLVANHPVRHIRLNTRRPDTLGRGCLKTKTNRSIKALLIAGAAVTVIAGCTIHPQGAQPVRPAGRKIVVIVVDSLTNQALQHAIRVSDFPALRYLIRHGQYVPNIISSFPSMTVSDISTVLTGSYPENHHIPGLVWIDVERGEVVNYGNNLRQTMRLGVRPVVENTLYHLNQTHLSKGVHTIFEDLQDAGYSTGAINMLVYRGRTPHRLSLPSYVRPLLQRGSYPVRGPDVLVFGTLAEQSFAERKDGMFHRFGLRDDFSIRSLVRIMKDGQLPDFTMVYLPDNDSYVHKYGVGQMKGVMRVEKHLQQVLGAFGEWSRTLGHVTLIVMGDSGVTPVLPAQLHPTIMLKDLFRGNAVYRWGKPFTGKDDVGFAVNSRMAYVYALNHNIQYPDMIRRLTAERRIDIVAGLHGNAVFATTPEHRSSQFTFYKNNNNGTIRDEYGQSWTLGGDSKILDLRMGENGRLQYGRYPDVLRQLWSALHSHKGRYLVVTAKKGYQFGDDQSPEHDGGAQQSSLLQEDVLAPIIVVGAKQAPKSLSRSVDLKAYFISLVHSQATTAGSTIRPRL
ncbi:MAG: alkaline phosphatase family protein [Bacilli bacterium]